MTARRRFLRSLAVSTLASPMLARAQTAPAPPAAAPSPSPSPGEPPGPVAEALGQAVQARFGGHLGPGDLAEIKKGIEGNLQAAERLRSRVKLGNADEPVTLFQARLPGPRPSPAAALPRRKRAPRS